VCFFFFINTLKTNMEASRSTDKLVAMTHIIDKIIDKLPPEKIEKIKDLSINWVLRDSKGYLVDHPLPEMKLSFYE